MKDKVTFIGIIFTAIIGITNLLFSILNTQRNVYANTILKERLESLNNFKQHTAKFLSLILTSNLDDSFEKNYRELKHLSCLLEYQFNSKKREELIVINKIRYLLKLIKLKNINDFNQIIRNIQEDNDLVFFRGLNLEFYNIKSITVIIDKKIMESIEELENLLKIHIKGEWEKIKHKQKILRFK